MHLNLYFNYFLIAISAYIFKINNIIITFQVAYKIGADFKLQKNDFGGYLAHDNYHEKTIL